MAQESLKASSDGVAKAKLALMDREWGREDLADKVEIKGKRTKIGISLQTIHNFFTKKPVSHKYFVAICTALGLSWHEIAESLPRARSENQIQNKENTIPLDTETSSLSIKMLLLGMVFYLSKS